MGAGDPKPLNRKDVKKRVSRFKTTAENEAAARQFDQDFVEATTIVLHPTSSSSVRGTTDLHAR